MYSKPSISNRHSRCDPLYSSSQLSLSRLFPVDRFIWLVVRMSPPKPITKIPRISTTCGGLRIITSSPKELCHQLSNGAEVNMQKPPHAAMKAPSGPWNPQIRTEDALAAASRANVVRRIKYAQHNPVSTAPN